MQRLRLVLLCGVYSEQFTVISNQQPEVVPVLLQVQKYLTTDHCETVHCLLFIKIVLKSGWPLQMV